MLPKPSTMFVTQCVACVGATVGPSASRRGANVQSVNVETSSKIAARTAFHLLVLRKRLTGLDPQQDSDEGDAVAPKSPPKRQQSFKLQDHPPAKIELRCLRLGDRLAKPLIAEYDRCCC